MLSSNKLLPTVYCDLRANTDILCIEDRFISSYACKDPFIKHYILQNIINLNIWNRSSEFTARMPTILLIQNEQLKVIPVINRRSVSINAISISKVETAPFEYIVLPISIKMFPVHCVIVMKRSERAFSWICVDGIQVLLSPNIFHLKTAVYQYTVSLLFENALLLLYYLNLDTTWYYKFTHFSNTSASTTEHKRFSMKQ